MMSVREQILQAVKAALMDQTPAADRVYRSRVQMLERNELPAIVVKAGDENCETIGLDAFATERNLEIRLEFYGAGYAADELLDPVIVAAHPKVMEDVALAGLVNELEERSTGEPDFDGNDDSSAQIVVTYAVKYFTQRNDLTMPV